MQSFAQAFSKACRVQGQSPWSRSAERETPKPSRQQAPACNAIKETPKTASASKRQQRSPHTEPPTRTGPPPRPENCAGGEMAGQKTNGKGERSLPPFARRRRNAGELPEERNLPFIPRSCPSEKRKPQEQPQTRDHYSLFIIHYSLSRHRRRFSPRPPFRGLRLMKTLSIFFSFSFLNGKFLGRGFGG